MKVAKLQSIHSQHQPTKTFIKNGIYTIDDHAVLIDLSKHKIKSVKGMNHLLKALSKIEQLEKKIKFIGLHSSILTVSRILGLSYLFITDGNSNENRIYLKVS